MSSKSMYFSVRDTAEKMNNTPIFKILENTGNGDCLLMSIIQFLENNETYEVPHVNDLRNDIVDYISHPSNWNRFMNTIICNLEPYLPILQENDISDKMKRKIYAKFMSQPQQYGTMAELQAASEMFNFVFVVFRKSHNREGETRYSCYSSEDHRLKPKMYLFFSGKPSSGHFQFMQPILRQNVHVVAPGEYKVVDKLIGPDDSTLLSVRKIMRTLHTDAWKSQIK